MDVPITPVPIQPMRVLLGLNADSLMDDSSLGADGSGEKRGRSVRTARRIGLSLAMSECQWRPEDFSEHKGSLHVDGRSHHRKDVGADRRFPNGRPSRFFEFSRLRGRVARTSRSGRGLIHGIADRLREGASLGRLRLRWRLDLAATAGGWWPLRDRSCPSLGWRPSLGGWRRRSAGPQHNHIGRLRGRWRAGLCHRATAAEHLVQKLIDVVWFHRIHSRLHRPTRRHLSWRRLTLLVSLPQQGVDHPHTESHQQDDEVDHSTDWRGEKYHGK
jgi:hypothetical protein